MTIVGTKGYSEVAGRWLYSDIWSNLHYGYVGRAAGFSTAELTAGAGPEQIGSALVTYAVKRDAAHLPRHSRGADNWLAGWDDPSENEAIRIGAALWVDRGLRLYPVDTYLAVRDNPRLATME